MSDMNIPEAVDRIRKADEPMAVFRSRQPECLNVVFARTARTCALINRRSPDYVGTFHSSDDPKVVRRALEHYVQGGA